MILDDIKKLINYKDASALKKFNIKILEEELDNTEELKKINLMPQEIEIFSSWYMLEDSKLNSILAFIQLFFLDLSTFEKVVNKLLEFDVKYFPFNVEFNRSEKEYNLSHKGFMRGVGFSYYGQNVPQIERILLLLEKHYNRTKKSA